jgi:hypothetical protein
MVGDHMGIPRTVVFAFASNAAIVHLDVRTSTAPLQDEFVPRFITPPIPTPTYYLSSLSNHGFQNLHLHLYILQCPPPRNRTNILAL